MALFKSKKNQTDTKPINNTSQISNKTSISTASTTPSYIGKNVSIKGTVICREPIEIAGEINGEIDSTDSVTIEKGSRINSTIKSKSINIKGYAKGTVTATDKVKIFSTGKFEGTINSGKLIMKEGAVFLGESNMKDSLKK